MIGRDDFEFTMVKDIIDAMVEHLIENPSPLAWASDGEGGWKRPKSGSEIETQSICFRALEEHFKEATGVDFVYSPSDFYWSFRDEWTWRTSP